MKGCFVLIGALYGRTAPSAVVVLPCEGIQHRVAFELSLPGNSYVLYAAFLLVLPNREVCLQFGALLPCGLSLEDISFGLSLNFVDRILVSNYR